MKQRSTTILLAALAAAGIASAAQTDGQPWFRREKVRCIAYLDSSKFMVSSVAKVRAMGFNCALVSWGGAPAGNLRPLVEAADRAGKRCEPVRWHEAQADPNGYLNLLSFFSEPRGAVAYCLTYVYSPADGPRVVMLGSHDGGKLFVNGEMVWGEPVSRSAEPGQNEPRAYFHRGWNPVLFKVLQTGGEWGIYLRVDDPRHELKYSPAPPAK